MPETFCPSIHYTYVLRQAATYSVKVLCSSGSLVRHSGNYITYLIKVNQLLCWTLGWRVS